jgi:glycosyltransferase involved in cell wall biosynthesis
MRVLLIEPYLGGSHLAWAEGLMANSRHDFTLVSHEARWWTWRMKGSAATLTEQVARLAAGGYRPDVVLVSDMTDVAALRAMLHPVIGRPPLALYFHETQFTYPDSPQMTPDLSYPFVNWTSALAADVVFFNSDYHRDAFFSELPRLLKSFPDHTHVGLIEGVEAKSGVLPVGVGLAWTRAGRRRDRIPLVLWNHRWEHDKDPETFADGIRAAAETHDFRVALAGERFRTVPGALDELADELSDRIVMNGHLARDEYQSLLLASDIAVSTARQEFFGISVVEAIAAGARPVLPARLSYPWLIPAEHHATVLYPSGGFAAALRRALDDPSSPDGLAESMMSFDWGVIAPRYDAALEAL